jgi:D-glycero-D-manno-heptose 1,7-bisphosphate phosphatase
VSVRLLFLDRDGTLNRSFGHRPPNVPEEVELLPNVASTLARYAADGWKLVVITNQGGVSRGYLSEAQACAVLQRVVDLLPVPVAATYLCPHMPGAPIAEYDLDCPNRKPRPGFILDAVEKFGAQPANCLLVGDAVTDRQTAQAAGVPFCWADRFFERPIDRGLQTDDGEWVQVREQEAAVGQDLCLVATKQGETVGQLTLLGGEPVLSVDEVHREAGIDTMLIETARECARPVQISTRSPAD